MAIEIETEPLYWHPQAATAPTPHFAFSADRLKQCAQAFADAFPDATVYYAVKSNGDPGVLQTLHVLGVCFELASVYELHLMAEQGVPAERLIYGTAVKPQAHIETMATYGVEHYALDSAPEIDKLARVAPRARIFVRVVVDDNGSAYTMSNKFGVEIEQAISLAATAQGSGLQFEGLSFNVGSQAVDPTIWARGIDQLRPAVEHLAACGLPVRRLNIGGGFPASYAAGAPAPALDEIADHTSQALKRLPYPRPKLILEPGRALVAEAGVLVTSIIARVPRGDSEWLFLDAGVYNALFEALSCQAGLRYAISPVAPSSALLRSYKLAGPTGDGLDVVSEDCRLPVDLAVGDRLVVHNAGAYSLSMASSFNGFPKPPVYVF